MADKKILDEYNTPIHGCLSIILLCALCGLALNECQSSSYRLKMNKEKYDQFMKNINTQKNDSTTYILKKEKTR